LLALEEKGVAYSFEPVEIFGPEGVPASHLARHPFGRIPVLRHGDFELFETTAITRYIDEAFSGPSLQPAAPARRARMNQVVSLLDSYAYLPMVWGIVVQRVRIPLQGGRADEEKASRSMTTAATCLVVLEEFLVRLKYLAGDELTLADLHAYPTLCYLALAPKGHLLLEWHENIARWFAAMRSQPSVNKTRTQYELRD
jgi:glutathione S-transferase